MNLRITTVTLDTNVFPVEELIRRAAKAGITAAVTEVTDREVKGTTFEPEARAIDAISETGVWAARAWAAGAWTEAAFSSTFDRQCRERALKILSNGSFPAGGRHRRLTSGQRKQLRDAMILCAHARSQRDVLVSNDRTAFVKGGRREQIAAELHVRVMTVEEFEQYLAAIE